MKSRTQPTACFRGPFQGQRRRLVVAVLAPVLVSSLAAVVGLGGAQAAGPGGLADQKKAVDGQLAESYNELAGLNAELQKAYKALQDVEQEMPAAQAAVVAAEEKVAEAKRRDAAIAVKLAAAEEAERSHVRQIGLTTEAMADTEVRIGRLAAQTYRNGMVEPSDLLQTLSSGGDLAEMSDDLALVDSVLKHQNSSHSRLGQQRAAMTNLQARAEAVRVEVKALKQQAAEAVQVAKAAELEAEARRAQVQALVEAKRAATAEIQKRKNEEEAQAAQLKRESDALESEMRRIAEEERRRAAEELRRRQQEREAKQRAQEEAARKAGKPVPRRPIVEDAPPPNSGTKLSRPTNGPVTSGYGMRFHPIYHYNRMHTGVDFGGGCGIPIKAAASGKVIKRGWSGGYGNQLVINHGLMGDDIVQTSYNHLASFAVGMGESVSRGQVIAYQGTTGASTGCHLHFEVFVNGSRVNPMSRL